jgi:hypothetical protein
MCHCIGKMLYIVINNSGMLFINYNTQHFTYTMTHSGMLFINYNVQHFTYTMTHSGMLFINSIPECVIV